MPRITKDGTEGIFYNRLVYLQQGWQQRHMVAVYALGSSTQISPLNFLETDRTLVLIQLRGGNDGFNTVIDRFNSEYYNIRPTLAISGIQIFGHWTKKRNV
ncbi:MAG: hypothetical protein IPL08_17235 [Saprospiraceae bacterium]|nr:hypothetical protein [Saprospiraceae bacterium]